MVSGVDRLQPADPRERVSVSPGRAPIDGYRLPVVLARQADADLDQLLATVLKERCAMHAQLRLPIKPEDQRLARGRLLAALEMYASALSRRGLLAPPKLRDELALQRALAARRR
jgi:hypothetical protein